MRGAKPVLTEALMRKAIANLELRTVMRGECWVTEKGFRSGYSQVSIDGWPFQGHVVAYKLMRGEYEEGLELDHYVCQFKPCWNPWHCEPVTHAENCARSRVIRFGSRKLDAWHKRNPGESTQRVRDWRARQKEMGK